MIVAATPLAACPQADAIQAAYVAYASMPSQRAGEVLQDAARACLYAHARGVTEADLWCLVLEGWALLGSDDPRVPGIGRELERDAIARAPAVDAELRATAQRVLAGGAP